MSVMFGNLVVRWNSLFLNGCGNMLVLCVFFGKMMIE